MGSGLWRRAAAGGFVSRSVTSTNHPARPSHACARRGCAGTAIVVSGRGPATTRVRTPSTPVGHRARPSGWKGRPGEGKCPSSIPAADDGVPGTECVVTPRRPPCFPDRSCAPVARGGRPHEGAVNTNDRWAREEPGAGYEVAHTSARARGPERPRHGHHTRQSRSGRGGPGTPGGTHVASGDVRSRGSAHGTPVPRLAVPARGARTGLPSGLPAGEGRVLWCIEPKARAVPPQFTCRHQEVEVPSG